MKLVILLTALVLTSGCAGYYPAGTGYQPQTQLPQLPQESYQQQRVREQIHQHGAGGCTPNFSTGGCL